MKKFDLNKADVRPDDLLQPTIESENLTNPPKSYLKFKIGLSLVSIIFIIIGYFFFNRQTQISETPSLSNKDQKPVLIKSNCEENYNQLISDFGHNYTKCEVPEPQLEQCEGAEDEKDATPKNINIEIILDASGSMAAQVDGESKMSAAKNAIEEFILNSPENAKIGLRVYGHLGSNSITDKPISCASTELIYPIQTKNSQELTQALSKFNPTGWTPIASSISQASSDFDKFNTEDVNIIYLVSDGEETCGGNPTDTVKQLKNTGINVQINVIGFAVDSTTRSQLQSIADESGGFYSEARNPGELRESFKKRQQEIIDMAKFRSCVAKTELSYSADLARNMLKATACITSTSLSELNDLNRESGYLYRDDKIEIECRDEIKEKIKKRRKDWLDISHELEEIYKSEIKASDKRVKEAQQKYRDMLENNSTT